MTASRGRHAHGVDLPSIARDEILHSARVLMAPGEVHEVRMPSAGRGTISGYFDDPEKLVDAVLPWDGQVPAIYLTLNPVKPDLLARAVNRLERYVKFTSRDEDILYRRRLLIDCDPIRPAGISSSASEHGRAIAVAMGVWDDWRGTLGDATWPTR